MNIESIKTDIEGIERLLDHIKFSLGVDNVKGDIKLNIPKKSDKKRKKSFGVKDYILEYIKNGFFDSPKTSNSILKEFQKRALTGCTTNSISMALMLLVRSGVLERNGLGKTSSPWIYKKI